VRSEPRLTRDADLAVAVSGDDEAERLVHALRSHGFTPLALIEQEQTGRIATVRLTNDLDDDLVSDLLFASTGIEREIVDGAEILQITTTLRLPVASVGHLIAMKLLARDDRHRPNDADDLRALRSVATASDWDTAETSVRLIAERGSQRDRDLLALLAVLRRDDAY
jgi:predicted nucleotidyltransferase